MIYLKKYLESHSSRGAYIRIECCIAMWSVAAKCASKCFVQLNYLEFALLKMRIIFAAFCFCHKMTNIVWERKWFEIDRRKKRKCSLFFMVFHLTAQMQIVNIYFQLYIIQPVPAVVLKMVIYLINIAPIFRFSLFFFRWSELLYILGFIWATTDDNMLKPITVIIGIFYLGELCFLCRFFAGHAHLHD